MLYSAGNVLTEDHLLFCVSSFVSLTTYPSVASEYYLSPSSSLLLHTTGILIGEAHALYVTSQDCISSRA